MPLTRVTLSSKFLLAIPMSEFLTICSTGMKCLPQHLVPQANGSILHDTHAETIALRSFNHLLLQECLILATSPKATSFLLRRRAEGEISQQGGQEWREGEQPFRIHEGLKLHMYCSEAPCGDASMELLMEKQADATPWPVEEGSLAKGLKGRGSFAELGVVRRKPGI